VSENVLQQIFIVIHATRKYMNNKEIVW